MKRYISESREVYEDMYHGLFSKKLAEWAIGNMEVKDTATMMMKPLVARSISDVQSVLKEHGIELPNEFVYTAWYLFNMALADYQKALPTDEHRAMFVDETINDPDCCPEAVLECFVAKMCAMEVPIFWEMYL